MDDSRFTPFEVMYAAAELEANRTWPPADSPEQMATLQPPKWRFRCLIGGFDTDQKGVALLRSPIGDPMSAIPASALLLEGLSPYSIVLAFESLDVLRRNQRRQKGIPAIGRWVETVPVQMEGGGTFPDGAEQLLTLIYASRTAMKFWTIPFFFLKDRVLFGDPSGPGDLTGHPRTPLLAGLDRILHQEGPTIGQVVDEIGAEVGPVLAGLGEQIKVEQTIGSATRYGYELLDNENFRYRSLEAIEAQANRN